eukprot:gnl/Dysnectes_brevis/1979_a2278_2412.p1 GENE.gnl/Dysnectes_brevis/1979_a2278_2412~~gnl/Dysnectes_brevis/1979_a2278_2412.p1  ORF type:complete len:214 (+),score=37.16 gnl/Dysnectes_brevis/1979_a2278_2412:30-644(+)
MAQAQAVSQGTITLAGSTEIVSEFFGYSINSILYLRGLYPPESFERRQKYGVTMMMTKEASVSAYVTAILDKVSTWLYSGKVRQLSIVVLSAATEEILERWDFAVKQEAPDADAPAKTTKEVHKEIQAIVRQITASVTFLPMIEEPCTFDVLVHTEPDVATPDDWEEAEGRGEIENAEEVKLRSFSTRIHTVQSTVVFAVDDDI